jgi:hypothetical protein
MHNWQLKSPVAFLVFNRPETTRKVFEAIREARPSRLLVVADGPRDGRLGDAEKCAAVRKIIEEVDWPCEVQKNYSDVNLGCKKRVSSGLDWIFDMVEEAIILEDDCLPHPDFFVFCEELLVRYRDDERVMMIGGTNYLLDSLNIKESFCFSRFFAIWGWATWRRAWKKYDISMRGWNESIDRNTVNSFYAQPFMRKFVKMIFDKAYNNEVNTWDTQWFYACLFNNGLSIVPQKNLISNIGLVGTHTTKDHSNNNFPVFGIHPEKMIYPEKVYPNHLYDNEFFARKIKRSMYRKIADRVYNLIFSVKRFGNY